MRKIERMLELLVTGKAIRGTVTALWKRIIKWWKWCWREIDRIIGLMSREVYKRTIKTNPRKVFFFTQEFRYGCNPKYICEELRRRNLEDIDIVWRVAPKSRGGVPKEIKSVKAGTLEYYRELFSSKIIVANSYIFLDQTTFLKKDQVLIQTWHGSLGIKKFGKNDMKDGWRRIFASIETGKMSNYCITNSDFVTQSLRNTYWPKTEMLQYGHPRNDLFFSNYKNFRNKLRESLCEKWGCDKSTRFVMYGPTFRDAKDFSCYELDYIQLLQALKNKFGGEWTVLLRYHPSLRKIYKSKGININEMDVPAIDVTGYLDMQELIAVTDVAITDYSSWIYDFMLQRRPGFIFATDIDEYNTERGFCYPLETTPFPIARNNKELMQNIDAFDEKMYLDRLEAFLKDKGCIEDGHASERVVDKMLELMEISDCTRVEENA